MSSPHKPLGTFSSNPDVLILFVTKGVRLFSYGSLAVPLFIYLKEIGINEHYIGLLLSLIMVGDLFITMLLTSYADKIGRRRTLAIGALLKLFTGIVFSLTNNFTLLVLSGIFGVISMSGSEIGPFLSIEQAALTDICESYKGDREE
jgi:MFS family permease